MDKWQQLHDLKVGGYIRFQAGTLGKVVYIRKKSIKSIKFVLKIIEFSRTGSYFPITFVKSDVDDIEVLGNDEFLNYLYD